MGEDSNGGVVGVFSLSISTGKSDSLVVVLSMLCAGMDKSVEVKAGAVGRASLGSSVFFRYCCTGLWLGCAYLCLNSPFRLG